MRLTAPMVLTGSAGRIGAAVVFALALAACDLTGAEAAAQLAAQREADGKAVGSACRHAGRAIEDCYALNAKAQRAAVFAGWREMDEYMRENKLEPVPPSLLAAGKQDRAERTEKSADRADKGEKPGKPEGSERRAAAANRAEPADADAKIALPPKPRVVKASPS